MEYWSIVYKTITPLLQYSSTPTLQYKKERNTMTPEDMRKKAEDLFFQGFH
jgi:hypothetical protein